LLPSSVPIMAGPLFSTIQAKFPKVRLHLMEGNSAQLEEQLGEGRLDMALLLREGEPTLSNDEPVLARLNLHVVASADAPLMQQDQVAFDDLQNLPLILPSPPHPLRARLAEIAQTRQVALDMAIEADSIRLQHAIAAEGGGYAITAGLSDAMTSGGNLVSREITQPSLLRCIVLGTTLRRPHTLATRAVYQLIQQLGSTRLQNGPGAV
jgi:LysR family nitrogen assimilation transcriptional regulator